MIKVNILLIIGLIIFIAGMIWLLSAVNNQLSSVPTYTTLTTTELQEAFDSGGLVMEGALDDVDWDYGLYDHTKGVMCNPNTACCLNE